MTAVSSTSGAALVRSYRIGGRLLTFALHDGAAALLAEKFLDCFYLAPFPAGVTPEASCTVEVFTGQPPPLPAAERTFEVPRGVCHADGQTFHLDIDESRIKLYPPPERRVSVWLGDTPHARHPVAVINALSYAIQGALRKSALFDLHAAGVVEPRGGAGLLIVGTSNSGKSSLTIRLAASGWGYLSDDMIALSGDAETVEAWALRRVFAVTEGAVARLDLPGVFDALGTPVNSDRAKRRLEPHHSFPGQFAESCVPRALCFARVTDAARSRLERLTRADAMRRLIRHCPWASFDTGTAREHLRVLGRLAAQCDSFALDGGRDLIEDPQRAAELLSSCFED